MYLVYASFFAKILCIYTLHVIGSSLIVNLNIILISKNMHLHVPIYRKMCITSFLIFCSYYYVDIDFFAYSLLTIESSCDSKGTEGTW